MYHIQQGLGCLVVFFIAFSPTLQSADELAQLINASEANLTGKLIFRQMEGNLTLMRNNGVLAADIPTDVVFEYVLPWHTPQSARLTYSWDLGNGESVIGRDPLVHCNYKVPGNYTLRLRVGASFKHHRLSGRFSKELHVLDAIRNIKLNGPGSYSVDQNTTLTLLVGGSSPKWICWRIQPDCLSTHVTGCNRVALFEDQLMLNLTFSSVGAYCLEISAHNDVSTLRTSYSFYVQSGPSSHLLFILPCTSVILASLILIAVSVSCPWCLRLRRKAELSFKESRYTCLEMRATDKAFRPRWLSQEDEEPPLPRRLSQEDEERPLLCDPGPHHST